MAKFENLPPLPDVDEERRAAPARRAGRERVALSEEDISEILADIKTRPKPEKIVQIAVGWLKEKAAKDPSLDWKDLLSDLLEEEKPQE